jgi:hypothetical protein
MRTRLTQIALAVGVAFIASVAGGAQAQAATGLELWSPDGDAYGRCLDLDTASGRVQMWECHGAANQDWNIVNVPGAVAITNRANGKCLKGNGLGNQLTAVTCSGQLEVQPLQWYPVDRGNGFMGYRNVKYPNFCMDIRDSGASRVVQLWSCTYLPQQLWIHGKW